MDHGNASQNIHIMNSINYLIDHFHDFEINTDYDKHILVQFLFNDENSIYYYIGKGIDFFYLFNNSKGIAGIHFTGEYIINKNRFNKIPNSPNITFSSFINQI
tara:strand:- start:1035 stop:1343 length:309 start_codon:yes stop_codon:yes gene_type:complete